MVVTPKEFAALKKRVEKLEGIIQVLKSVNCTVSAPLQDKLKALETLYGQFSVHTLCDALEVPRGTFYNHILRNKKENKSYHFRRTELSDQIRRIYDESDQIYGAKKISAVLKSRGVTVSDVTYFAYNKKTYYMCAILDLYSRKVLCYKISQKHSSQLITSTFRSAYEDRRPAEGLIFHSDRGTQYIAFAFQQLLKTLHVGHPFLPLASRVIMRLWNPFSPLSNGRNYIGGIIIRRKNSRNAFKNTWISIIWSVHILLWGIKRQTPIKPCILTGKQQKKNRHGGSKAVFRRSMR